MDPPHKIDEGAPEATKELRSRVEQQEVMVQAVIS